MIFYVFFKLKKNVKKLKNSNRDKTQQFKVDKTQTH